MPAPRPKISETVAEELHQIIVDAWIQLIADQQILWTLKELLNEASIIPDNQLSPAVVTVDSWVTLRFSESLDDETLQLVYPKDANIHAARLSVLTPIGVSILGRAPGDLAVVQYSSGVRPLLISDVTQADSEAASAQR